LLLALLLAPILHTQAEVRQMVIERSAGYAEAHAPLAYWLRDHTSHSSTAALMDIGMIGFFSDRYILDITGLANKEIAARMHQDLGLISGSEQSAGEIAAYVLGQEPEIIVLAHASPPGVLPLDAWSHDKAIYGHPEFKGNYVYLFSRQYSETYYLSVYRRSTHD
jgi:hypothetical protein